MSYSLGSPTATALGGGILNVTPTQDSTVGSTGTSFTTALNSSQVANGGETFTIYQNLGGYYQGASNDPVTLTVGLPGANFVTGGGYLLNNATAGKYAGTKGMKTNLGFTMQYNKSGTNLKGQCNIIVRSGGRIYQIKSNAINSLNVGTADKVTGAIPAMFNTKANFTDITDPLLPVSLGGNMDLTVNMLDVSTGGQGDQVSIHLQASTGELFFSSNWSTTTGKTALQVLGGGNVSVKTNGVAAGARTTDGTATTTTVSTTTSSQLVIDNKLAVEGLQVQVGPNPTINQFTVTVSSNESAAITMRVSDASGRMVDLKPGITPNSTVTIGANYKSGMYYLEVIQGNTRKMVKLMKIN
jgi:hypothetical protein